MNAPAELTFTCWRCHNHTARRLGRSFLARCEMCSTTQTIMGIYHRVCVYVDTLEQLTATPAFLEAKEGRK